MHKAYGRFVSARVDRAIAEDRDDGKAIKEANRNLWAAAKDMVRLHRQTQEPIPEEVAFEIETELGYLVAGVEPPTLSKLGLRGRHRTPAEENDKRSAVMYICACRAGLIDDPNPLKTLCGWFRMNDPRTLQRWQARPDLADVDPYSLILDLPDPDQICPDVRQEMISERMSRVSISAKASGHHWHEIKRSKGVTQKGE
jgi:hypothetical protein